MALTQGESKTGPLRSDSENPISISREQNLTQIMSQLSTSSVKEINFHYSPHYQMENNTSVVSQCQGVSIGSNNENDAGRSTKQEVSCKGQEEECINILKRLQITKQKDELTLQFQRPTLSAQNVPIVHPQLLQVDFYTDCGVVTPKHYKPSYYNSQRSDISKTVNFQELVQQTRKFKFISLVGAPGSGKSTMTRRLAKAVGDICFYVNCMDINYPDHRKLVLRELLLDNCFPELDKETCKVIFRWLLQNEEKCVLLLDGYDQAEWVVSTNPPNETYDIPQNISDLVANLCRKHYLPQACLILTSRPHSMIYIPRSMRPDVTFILQDLALTDMEKLFFAFAGEEAEQLWQHISDKAPQLVGYCQNPLILQMYIGACLSSPENATSFNTQTRMFTAVLEDIRGSDNTRHSDISTMADQFGRLAFKATLQSRVVMSVDDLKAEHLDVTKTQDLILAFHDNGRVTKVFNGNLKLYFSHQMLQEYFSARYIAQEMSLKEFEAFLKKDLFTDNWLMVRRFLCGLLFDSTIPSDSCSSLNFAVRKVAGLLRDKDVLEGKRRILMKTLFEKMKCPEKRELLHLCLDIRECNKEKVTMKAAERFPSVVLMNHVPLSSSDSHAIAQLLKYCAKRLEFLVLYNCRLNTSAFFHISHAIQQMPGSIDVLDIQVNCLSDKAIDLVCGILPKINEGLLMELCFIDSSREPIPRSCNPEEIYQLQEAINKLENSELKIKARSGDKLLSKETKIHKNATNDIS